MKLSILIPTLKERHESFMRIKTELENQRRGLTDVEICVHDGPRSMSTGEKRNLLINYSVGDHFCFVDDDDMVEPYYIRYIKQALEHSPDVVTFNGWMTTDGSQRVDWVIKLGEKYEKREGKYYRWPNHLAVMRREAVEGIKFPHVWHGEDYQWSVMIKNKGVLKTSVHIDKQLYHYDFKTRK